MTTATDDRLVDSIEHEQDGLHVEKFVEAAGDDVAHVTFVLESRREDPVSIRLVDDIPASLPDGRVGLHPDHRDDWSVEKRRLIYEADLGAGETHTTLYGINTTDPDEVTPFSDTPDLTVNAASDPFADGPSDPEPVRTTESDGGVPADDPLGSVPDADAGTGTDDGGVLAALAAELEAGDSDDEHVEVLREAVSRGGGRGSVEARLRHVQTTVDDLEAYRDALEEFIDDNGTARELVDDFESALDDLRADLDDVEATVAETEERLDDVAQRLDDLAGVTDDVARVEDDVADLRVDVRATSERQEEDVARLEEELGALREDLGDVADVAEAGRKWRAGIASAARVDDGAEGEGFDGAFDAADHAANGADGDAAADTDAHPDGVAATSRDHDAAGMDAVDGVDDADADAVDAAGAPVGDDISDGAEAEHESDGPLPDADEDPLPDDGTAVETDDETDADDPDPDPDPDDPFSGLDE